MKDTIEILRRVSRRMIQRLHPGLWRYGYLFGFDPRETDRTRAVVAAMFLKGCGIEIGALHNPVCVPTGVSVRYVDRLSKDDLERHYPELSHYELNRVDIVDDGETLGSIADGSQDFVIANQFLEHCENPIGALHNFMRVLHPGGILLFAVPDKRYGIDRTRPLTDLNHLVACYRGSESRGRRALYEEGSRHVLKMGDARRVEAKADELMGKAYSIHFNVWTQAEVFELLARLQSELEFPFSIELTYRMGVELLLVLRKEDE